MLIDCILGWMPYFGAATHRAAGFPGQCYCHCGKQFLQNFSYLLYNNTAILCKNRTFLICHRNSIRIFHVFNLWHSTFELSNRPCSYVQHETDHSAKSMNFFMFKMSSEWWELQIIAQSNGNIYYPLSLLVRSFHRFLLPACLFAGANQTLGWKDNPWTKSPL